MRKVIRNIISKSFNEARKTKVDVDIALAVIVCCEDKIMMEMGVLGVIPDYREALVMRGKTE